MAAFESTRTIFKVLPDMSPVVDDVSRHFQNQGYEVKTDRGMAGDWDISITKSSTFKAICGMRSALKIELRKQNNGTFVKAGVGIFGQQAIPTIITMLVFWPLLVTQIWGMINQSKLDKEAMRIVEESFDRHTDGDRSTTVPPVIPLATQTAIQFCTSCGQKIAPGSRFCPQCGTTVV